LLERYSNRSLAVHCLVSQSRIIDSEME
jgi:hypothetical protein